MKIRQLVLVVVAVLSLAHHPGPGHAQDAPTFGGLPVWSPDGAELAIAFDTGLFIYNRDFDLLRAWEHPVLSPFPFGVESRRNQAPFREPDNPRRHV